MSKLNVDQKTIRQLFEDRKADFLVPDYQRPYAWTEVECQTLWDDIFNFAIPDNDSSRFNRNDEYFLGPIVTFVNDNKKMEIIDGQQRLTTLMLLLRAFYEKYGNMQDEDSRKVRETIEQCIWKTDEFGKPIKSELKIDSEVATDNDKEEFLVILRTGSTSKDQKSNYAVNYRFMQAKIDEFLNSFPGYFNYLPNRIINNCILLPIEAESQDTALRIFSTLNDRGKPLSDADIFKSEFYKFYSNKSEKDLFIDRWKSLDELCENLFRPISGTPMDELFTRYMYYERAKMGITSSTTEALRKFYDKENYRLLKNENTFENLIVLAEFWNDVLNQNEDRFSEIILRRLYVLNYAPNGIWTFFVSVYFMHNKDVNGLLDEDAFYLFLQRITAFIWTYAVTNPGVNALRTPVYAEMVNIIKGEPVEFSKYKFDAVTVESQFNNFSFLNGRPITKSMLTWWAFQDEKQKLLSLETIYEIEHIFAKSRQVNEKSLQNIGRLEMLGNKALLEKRINIRASDYRFEDKTKYYKGFTNSRGQIKEGTQICELITFADSLADFRESEIIERDKNMISGFLNYLDENSLLR